MPDDGAGTDEVVNVAPPSVLVYILGVNEVTVAKISLLPSFEHEIPVGIASPPWEPLNACVHVTPPFVVLNT